MKNFIKIFLVVSLISCSGTKQNKIEQPASIPSAFVLSDSLFVYKNIKNSTLTKTLSWDYQSGVRVFTDSTHKTVYTKLDSNQMQRLIAPVLPDHAVGIAEYMEGHFISRQENVYDYTPIVVWVNGDDFGELIYILLDTDNKPVSGFVLYGGDCGGGQFDFNDTLLTYCPEKHCSSIEGKKIITYTLDTYDKKEWYEKPDSIEHPSYVDSVTFETLIRPDGTFESKRIDSVRFTRQY